MVDQKDDETVKKQEKWIEEDLMALAAFLHSMKANIIPLFKGYLTTKCMIEALDKKYV